MKNCTFLIIAIITLYSCQNLPKDDTTQVWGKAQWIGYETLADSLKIVPGVHSLGTAENDLGPKGKKRPVTPYFRKDFKVDKKVKHAEINISGLGHYELSINGAKIGASFLAPGWTNYSKKELYNTYDVTDNIHSRGNTIGAIVGNGFYNINKERYRKLVIAHGYPKLIFNLKITYTDGSTYTVVSDDSCKVSKSPITFNSIFGGEDYDARLENEKWNTYGFDDSSWQPAVVLEDKKKKLALEEDYPLKVMQTFAPERVITSKTGRTIYDFGQNSSGIVSLKVIGNSGAKIIIRPDELLDEDMNITQRSGGGPYEFNYTLRGDNVELWQPKFSYYGFRYADVEIIEPEKVEKTTEILELKMLHTRNSSPKVGSFASSDTLFNKIYNLIDWGIKSNMASVATDCPHREKLGWLEQTYLIGPSLHYNYDIKLLYKKIVLDMIDAQTNTGLVPNIAPEFVHFGPAFRDSPEWGSASVIIPWQIYKWYGDKKLLEKSYPMMTGYADFLQTKLDGNLLHHGLGDWFDLGPKDLGTAQLTPKTVTASAIYFYDLSIVAKVAQMLNKLDDVKKYTALSEDVKEAFQNKFYDSKTGICSTGSQTAYAMSLYTKIIPAEDTEKIFGNLVNSIKDNNYKLTSGDIGYHFLVRTLSENGRSDILYKMNNRSDRPGYGYQIEKGATALTESWMALPNVSNNHMMLGHLMEWFYTGLGGIYQEENSVAYKNIIIAPKPVGDMKWVKCSFNSPKGTILSEWKRLENTFELTIEIPKGTSARVVIPEAFKDSKPTVIDLKDQKSVINGKAESMFSLNSGYYKIIAKL